MLKLVTRHFILIRTRLYHTLRVITAMHPRDSSRLHSKGDRVWRKKRLEIDNNIQHRSAGCFWTQGCDRHLVLSCSRSNQLNKVHQHYNQQHHNYYKPFSILKVMSMKSRDSLHTSIKHHAVAGLGLIETGLDHQESTATTHATNTSTSKPGRCIIRKYCVKNRRKELTLLHPMKLTIPSGSLTAIIGPSGCGKTALLKFLSECTDASTVAEGEGKM